MRFSSQEEYGLRCMLQLARHAPAPPGAMSIAEVAEHESLSPAYVAKLMRILRQAGLVEGTRGQKGGYQLVRPADEVTIGEVLVALGGKLYSDEFCDRHAGNERRCVHTTDCSIRSLWSGLDRLVHSVLDRCTLADLAGDPAQVERWLARPTGPRAVPTALPLAAARAGVQGS